MNALVRIATRQFCFIQLQVEDTTPAKVVEIERQLQELYFPSGIPEDEMNEVVNTMMKGETVLGGIEIYERMNTSQKYTTQTIKRWLKRQDYLVTKQSKTTEKELESFLERHE